jgi:hypothetical protein
LRADIACARSFRRVRSHRVICKAALDPFEDSQDMLRSEIEQPAEPSS